MADQFSTGDRVKLLSGDAVLTLGTLMPNGEWSVTWGDEGDRKSMLIRAENLVAYTSQVPPIVAPIVIPKPLPDEPGTESRYSKPSFDRPAGDRDTP